MNLWKLYRHADYSPLTATKLMYLSTLVSKGELWGRALLSFLGACDWLHFPWWTLALTSPRSASQADEFSIVG